MQVLKFKKGKSNAYMVRVNRKEALKIIQSLTNSLLSNTNREEFRTENNEYFSIAVHEEPDGEMI